METDRETVEQLVKKLKEEIKHVNAFVILFNGQVCWQWSSMSFFSFGQSPRFTHGLKSMIKLFEDIFGPGFWPNVIFAVSRYDRTLSQLVEKTLERQLVSGHHPSPDGILVKLMLIFERKQKKSGLTT